MPRVYFTERDAEFLRAAYFLDGSGTPVGPARLARVLGVSRVTALNALRRLAAFGFGEYVQGEGLRLTEPGRREVEEGIWRHHVVEKLLSESMGMPCADACSESSRIQFDLSDEFVRAAYERLGRPENCDCGCTLSPPYNMENLRGCEWCKSLFAGGMAGSAPVIMSSPAIALWKRTVLKQKEGPSDEEQDNSPYHRRGPSCFRGGCRSLSFFGENG